MDCEEHLLHAIVKIIQSSQKSAQQMDKTKVLNTNNRENRWKEDILNK